MYTQLLLKCNAFWKKKLSTRALFIVSPHGPEYVWNGPVPEARPPKTLRGTAAHGRCGGTLGRTSPHRRQRPSWCCGTATLSANVRRRSSERGCRGTPAPKHAAPNGATPSKPTIVVEDNGRRPAH
jgi:hypothetical protein